MYHWESYVQNSIVLLRHVINKWCAWICWCCHGVAIERNHLDYNVKYGKRTKMLKKMCTHVSNI